MLEINLRNQFASSLNNNLIQKFILFGWRISVIFSIWISQIRGSVRFSPLISDFGWNVIQFGLILVAFIFSMASVKKRKFTKAEKIVGLILSAFLFWYFYWTIIGNDVIRPIGQFMLTMFMLSFLSTTGLFRWSNIQKCAADLSWIVVGVASSTFYSLALAWTGSSEVFGSFFRFSGLNWNPNYLGVANAICGLLGLILLSNLNNSKLLKVLLKVSTVVLITGLIMSGSRGSLIAFAIGYILISIRSGKIQNLANLAMVASSIFFAWLWSVFGVQILAKALISSTSSGSNNTADIESSLQVIATDMNTRASEADVSSGRLDIYLKLLNYWLRNPMEGTGFHASEQIPFMHGFVAHNIYLTMLVEGGLIGFILFAGLIVGFIFLGKYSIFFPVFIAVLVSEMFESALWGWGSPMTLVMWLSVSAYVFYGEKLQNS